MPAEADTNKTRRAAIGRRPAADPAAAWVRRDDSALPSGKASAYTARLTLDVTPGLRGRVKVIAFQRGITVADMLRALLEREYPEGTA